MGALMAFYLGVITWAQDWGHARSQLRDDLWFIAPIVLGFGSQVGLFTYLRRLHAARMAGAATAGSAGVSTATMLACCAHHLADVLPVVGLSGAAIFLNDVKTPLAVVSLAMNAFGVVLMLRLVYNPRRA